MNKETIKKAPNLSNVLRPYENKWVALSSDKKYVLASGNTLGETAARLGASEKPEAVFMKVSATDRTFSLFVL